MNKKWFIIVATALFSISNISSIYAQAVNTVQEQTTILTLDEAIKKAQEHSIQLKQNAREYDLNKEKVDFAFNTGIYELWAVNDSNLSYTHKQKSILEEQIAINVTKAFDTIQYLEKQLLLLKEQKAVQEKLLKKSEIEHKNGHKSALSLEQGKADLSQMAQNIANLEQDITLEYTKLSQMLGISLNKYSLEAISHSYTPFETRLTVDQFAKSKASEHISVWHAAEQVKMAYLPIYTTDYMEFITQQEQRKLAEDQQELTEQQLEEQIRNLYVENAKLQSDYELLQHQMKLQEKELEASRIYLEKGRIAPLEYEQKQLAYHQNQLKALQMLNNQFYNVSLLKKPYLISVGFK